MVLWVGLHCVAVVFAGRTNCTAYKFSMCSLYSVSIKTNSKNIKGPEKGCTVGLKLSLQIQ